jgi:hypothetical protein
MVVRIMGPSASDGERPGIDSPEGTNPANTLITDF